jgi:hypothetical protein
MTLNNISLLPSMSRINLSSMSYSTSVVYLIISTLFPFSTYPKDET